MDCFRKLILLLAKCKTIYYSLNLEFCSSIKPYIALCTLSFYQADLYWPSTMFIMRVSFLLSDTATSLLQIKRSSTSPKLISSDNHAMVSKSQRDLHFRAAR